MTGLAVHAQQKIAQDTLIDESCQHSELTLFGWNKQALKTWGE